MILQPSLDSTVVPFGFESGLNAYFCNQTIARGLDRAHEVEVLAQLE